MSSCKTRERSTESQSRPYMHFTLTTTFQVLLHKTDIVGPYASRGASKSIESPKLGRSKTSITFFR